MAVSRLALAQRGILLADAVPDPAKMRRGRAKGKRTRGGTAGPRAVLALTLTGPFLSPGSLTAADALRLIDGIERVLEGVYTHLPLKRARYGFDPVQRLRILRSQIRELSDDAFHFELAESSRGFAMRTRATRAPRRSANKVAALPFLVEMIGSVSAPTYSSPRSGAGSTRRSSRASCWSTGTACRSIAPCSGTATRKSAGGPTARRVGRPEPHAASLQYGPPPDEHWVAVGYRTAGPWRTGRRRKRRSWQVVDPAESTPAVGRPDGAREGARRTRAIDPAAEASAREDAAVRAARADRTQAKAADADAAARAVQPTAGIIRTSLTQTLKAMPIDAPGGPFGYLRSSASTRGRRSWPSCIRLIPLLPDRGLSSTSAATRAGTSGPRSWRCSSSRRTSSSRRASPRSPRRSRARSRRSAIIGEDLAPWKASLDAAVRNGELYAQPIPITDPDACNVLGHMFGGPVVLVADSTTYSSGDLVLGGIR